MNQKIVKTEDFIIHCDDNDDQFSHVKLWYVKHEKEFVAISKEVNIVSKVLKGFSDISPILLGVFFAHNTYGRNITGVDIIGFIIMGVVTVILQLWLEEELSKWRKQL